MNDHSNPVKADLDGLIFRLQAEGMIEYSDSLVDNPREKMLGHAP